MSSIGLILFYVVLIAGMWFLLMRPQKNLVIIRTAESRCRNQRSLRSKSREQNKQTGLSRVRKEQRRVKM